ncbi:substrate-binding domain-containing protein [Stackebrandtia albiflava]|uniref:substrate-binding domain-containing protein n=1 Tax=Stackebrandtia albiflava TaxID=406432 RepID=UPI0013150FDE|nr:substrate-binding domain-containing protein [Stackebrandtia albiflava]
MTTIVTLVASGLVLGYTWLLGTGCSGEPIRATVVAAPDVRESLSVLARQWEGEEPSLRGQCIAVDVQEKSSAEVATKLATTWNTVTDGARPHVWIPDSSVWVQMLEAGETGALMVPDQTPYLATSPTVIAMPVPMAEAMGWSADGGGDLELTWTRLLELAEDGDWSDFGNEEWGGITLGLSSPRDSTAGMHALLSLTDVDGNGDVVDEELANVIRLKQALSQNPVDTDTLLREMAEVQEDDLNGYVSAFPALERDVWRFNNYMKTGTKLAAVYPSDGSLDADHPIVVLENVEWTDQVYQEIGRQFTEYITGEAGEAELLGEGFRDGTRRTGGETLNDTEGLTPQIEESQRGPVQPSAVSNALAAWQALNRPANVLLALDTSESMGATVSYKGEELARLEVVRRELIDALDLFGSQANIGLWDYSTAVPYSGENDYTPLVNVGEFDDAQKALITDSLQQMSPGGGSALFDTAAAAYEALQNDFNEEPGAANLVVIISDGGNEDDNGGLTLADFEARIDELSQRESRTKQVSIVTIGFGGEVDEEALRGVAEASRGLFFPAEWNDQLKPQLLNALFNAV